jgi:hypothetical protein
MRGLLLSLSQVSSRLLFGLLVLSTHLLWAQGTSTREESAVPLPDAPSEVQTHLHLTHEESHLTYKQNQGQTYSSVRFFPDHTGYDRLSVITDAVLSHDSGTIEFRDPNEYFIGSTPTKRMTFAPIFGHVHQETTHCIPWVGPVVLRIGKEAEAHPHIATVLKTVHPQF